MKFYSPLIGTKLVEDLVDRQIIPAQATRVIIDSGNPGDVVRVYSAGFADVDGVRAFMDGLGKEYSEQILDLIQRSKLLRDRLEHDSEPYALLFEMEGVITTLAIGLDK